MAGSHLANRVAMASRLVDFLDEHLPAGSDLDLLEHADWAHLAHLAGEQHTPSTATQAAVITGLHQRRSSRNLGPQLLDGIGTRG